MKAWPTAGHMWHIRRTDNLWLIYSSFTDEQRDLSNSDTQRKDGEVTDTPFIHKINDAKTIIRNAKTITKHIYLEYQEVIAKHLAEIIKMRKKIRLIYN